MNGERNTVVVMQMASFLVFTVGRSPNNVQLPPSWSLGSWALLTIILAIGVDTGMGEISAALTILIFVTVMLLYGVDLFDWMLRKINQKPQAATTRIPTGRYTGKEIPTS